MSSIPGVALHGDEHELYREHHQALLRVVARDVNASSELVEDACQTAWTIMLRRQPDRDRLFAWLCTVAIHEAYGLCRMQRPADDIALATEVAPEAFADRASIDTKLDALEALRTLAALPDRQRRDLALLVGGYSYREIARMTGGRTYTNVNRHIAQARRGVRERRSLAG